MSKPYVGQTFLSVRTEVGLFSDSRERHPSDAAAAVEPLRLIPTRRRLLQTHQSTNINSLDSNNT